MNDQRTFSVAYYKRLMGDTERKFSHEYSETWNRLTACHCPNCGKQGAVWRASDGDYYVGEQHICTACAFQFHMPSAGVIEDHEEANTQRLQRLKESK